jgi:hypothetical protein
MAHDDLVCPPPVPPCDYPARRLALCAFHAQLSRRRRSARGARSGCLLRNGAAMGIEIRADVRPRTSPRTSDLFGVGFRCRASARRGIRGQFADPHPLGDEAVFVQQAPSTCRTKGAKDHRARDLTQACSRHMFIALYGARPEIMHEVQGPLTMPVHPERIEFESPQLHQEGQARAASGSQRPQTLDNLVLPP